MKKRPTKKLKTTSLAEITRWKTTWQSRGKGRDPITHETGEGIAVARQPHPERELNFN